MSTDPPKHNRAPSLSLQTHGTGQIDLSSANAVPKSQKQMTKAERRELQERQRAAKAAAAAAKAPVAGTQTGGPAAKPPHQTPSTSSHPKKGGKGSESPVQTKGLLAVGPSGPPKSTKEPKATAEDSAERSRGLRIFSHFALQKPAGHVVKGDVHPAIVRLGLMFAEFKICGANARCIATLSVFKRVRLPTGCMGCPR
jgi:translation initiation factor eIF-2B subunit delta